MKKKVLFKESELRNAIKESVDEVLNEIGKYQKNRNNKNIVKSFKNNKRGGYGGIKNIVVLTAENPDSQEQTRQFNKKANHSLLNYLKNNGYVCIPAKGVFGGNVENPYAVFNLSIDVAKRLSGMYQQTSFIYTEFLNDGTVHSEYWEKMKIDEPYSVEENDYVKKDECSQWNDMSDANDNFTVIGSKFKYNIPFPIFEDINKLISGNLQRLIEMERKNGNKTINEEKIMDFVINRVGISPYLRRKLLINGFYNN